MQAPLGGRVTSVWRAPISFRFSARQTGRPGLDLLERQRESEEGRPQSQTDEPIGSHRPSASHARQTGQGTGRRSQEVSYRFNFKLLSLSSFLFLTFFLLLPTVRR